MGDYEGLIRDRFVKTWDDRLNDPATRGAMKTVLKTANPALQAVFQGQGAHDLTNGEVTHFDQHWLEPSFFPAFTRAQKDSILRLAYLDALKKSEQSGRPIRTLWVCLPENGDCFQVAVHSGPNQVTVLIAAFVTPAFNQPLNRVDADSVTWYGPLNALQAINKHGDPLEVIETADGAIGRLQSPP